jgi:hypothetical protein
MISAQMIGPTVIAARMLKMTQTVTASPRITGSVWVDVTDD